jgi:hypothetical protein
MTCMSQDRRTESGGELEFFGVKLKVKNERLAALLNSNVTDDVQVVGRRAREAFTGSDVARAEREVARRMLAADAPVTVVHDDIDTT